MKTNRGKILKGPTQRQWIFQQEREKRKIKTNLLRVCSFAMRKTQTHTHTHTTGTPVAEKLKQNTQKSQLKIVFGGKVKRQHVNRRVEEINKPTILRSIDQLIFYTSTLYLYIYFRRSGREVALVIAFVRACFRFSSISFVWQSILESISILFQHI